MLLENNITQKKNQKLSFKIALGGIIAAFSLALIFMSSMLTMLNYTIPCIAGMLIAVTVIEADKKTAFLCYLTVSILSILITPNFESSLLFIMFMGYYPILKSILERNCNRMVEQVIKFVVFNVAVVLYYKLFMAVFTSPESDEAFLKMLGKYAKYANLLLLGMANVFFVMYDNLLSQLVEIYIKSIRKRFFR